MSKLITNFNASKPAVSINAYGVTLNSACSKILGYPEFVAIGVDRLENKLAIKPLKSDKKAFRCYPYKSGESDCLIVRSTKLINEINKLAIDTEEEKAYPATFNPIKGIVVVELL